MQELIRSVRRSTQQAHNFNTDFLHKCDVGPHLGQGRVVRGNIIKSDDLGVVVLAIVEMEGSNDEMGCSRNQRCRRNVFISDVLRLIVDNHTISRGSA